MSVERRHFLAAAAGIGVAPQARAAAPLALFNGTSLAGWSVREGPDNAFFVKEGAITVNDCAGFPTWLRYDRAFENFDFRGEFFVEGWCDGGVYFHAPEHGRNSWEGFQLKIFHQVDPEPRNNSMGSIFPVLAPRLVNVKSKGEWNTFRIRMDWPRLQVWTNDALIHDLDLESNPEFKYRRRSGYMGIASLSYPVRFRNLTVEELAPKEKWEVLLDESSGMAHWLDARGKTNFRVANGVMRGDGPGDLTTLQKYRDFELRMYVRGMKDHNSGVMFRMRGEGEQGRYEIQLHDPEEAHYPTGSLYFIKRAIYPKIAPEKWFPFHLIVKDRHCLVRINGETVCEYEGLTNLDEGPIGLQAHRQGSWTEFKDIRIKRL